MTSRRPLARAAGVLWLLGAVVYVGGEAIAAAAFPGYSYAANYISDLGVPDVELYQGRAIDSPLSAVMNAAFVLQGLLYLAAAIVSARAVPGGRWRALLAPAAAFAVGSALIGVVHGSRASAESGIGWLHVLGAALAIIGGNAASIAVGATARRHQLPRAYAIAGTALGAVGLAALILLRIDSGTTGFDLLPDGVWERLAVYSITAWQVLTGVVLLRRRPPGTDDDGRRARSG
ncbi:DUF998 domain-containing protein [Rathayibacter caricis]|uniref:DUF998 domain-containing protein n=1 Tax=Rathayibacter caricis TaxID=110936 RepID=UPI001FB3382D|nr:DUF998 domain-containing protein [Rathayibacter caricis]MCJ1697113.1 DUF998 domain-containing protein [Rathayibacter caricis]